MDRRAPEGERKTAAPSAPGNSKVKLPSLDDIDGLGGDPVPGLDGILPESPGSDGSEVSGVAFRHAQVVAIRRHVSDMTNAVAAALSRSASVTNVCPRIGSDDVEDADFGPWFDCQALDTNRDGNAVLPVPLAGGAQKWQYLERWRVLGPIPFKRAIDIMLPWFPAMVPARDAPTRGGAWIEVAAESTHGRSACRSTRRGWYYPMDVSLPQ
jgi:hypothetical protein